MKEKCDCGHDDCECDEMTSEDVANYADDKIDALIDLLIKKGVITEEEFGKEYEALFEEDSEEDSKEE